MHMKVFFCSSLFLIFILASCSSEKQADASSERSSLLASIDSLEKKMFNQQTMELDRELASREIGLYLDFVTKFPQDTLSPEFLFRSSDLSRGLSENLKAIEYLSRISKEYPAYKKMPECLFLQGYYYQEFFRDTIQAKNFYVHLISKYPKHPFANDAKALMQMFGKSESDIIKEFEKKAAEKQGS